MSPAQYEIIRHPSGLYDVWTLRVSLDVQSQSGAEKIKFGAFRMFFRNEINVKVFFEK